jgi:hypothetical protein
LRSAWRPVVDILGRGLAVTQFGGAQSGLIALGAAARRLAVGARVVEQQQIDPGERAEQPREAAVAMGQF